ncbi:MAG: response regulator, partial [Deltaproteobacteria bacterium]|nr:response regulator [Deltaproteobacteria bacterium]
KDDPDVRRLVRSVFEEYGYKVIEAENGDEAVERFKEHAGSIDLLILDVLMPHRKGREVYEEIKGMRRDIKAIFLSGYPEQTVRKNLGIADGMNFISKPLSPNDLLKKVREVIQKK